MNRIITLRLISSERRTTSYGADMPGKIICEVIAQIGRKQAPDHPRSIG
jgi:hypothetical protein